MMEILHARSICETDQEPAEVIGTSVTTRVHSVICNVCGRAGEVATPGNEEAIRVQWALRNGYELERVNGQWEVRLLVSR